MRISNITYRGIRSTEVFGGSFLCTAGALKCTGIKLQDVQLNVSRSGCEFANVVGKSVDVKSSSCRVPTKSDDEIELKLTDCHGVQYGACSSWG